MSVFRLLLILVLAVTSLPLSAQKYQEMIEAGTFTLAAIQQEAESHFDVVGRGKGTGYKQFKRWEYVAQLELDAQGVKISNFTLSSLARDYRRAEREKQTESNNFGGAWVQLGPTYHNATSGWNPGVGRVTSIGIETTNTDHIIVGSPTGGVWKTTDGGSTWIPLTDDYTTVDVYSLEISPYNNQHYLWGSTSGRVFQSLDGGATWAGTGNIGGSGRISRIQFHPTDPTVVYAVSESVGLYRSTNSGNTWTAVSGASGEPGYDVEFKPNDPSTIYFSGRNVYRSTNGGTSFSQINNFGTANNNYKMMGVSPANPSIVYVLESNGGRFGAFYKSTNSGTSFNKLIDGADINYFGYSATGDDDRGQAPRDMDVAVNPFDAQEVHIAGIHTWKSTNGGTSFNLSSHWVPGTAASLGVGYNHADIDILKFVENTLYVGSDGGFYKSFDQAASFVDFSPGLCIKEFYKIGVSKTNPNVVSGGSQDNGTSVMRGANRAWVDWLGADGMETFVDWNNPNILYGTSQYGSMYRSTNQGNTRSSITSPTDEDGAWVTPFEQDPLVPNTIYSAFEDIWKSTNSGSSWTKISDFADGNFNQMKLAPTDNQRIYASRGSNLFTTANGGTTWVATTKNWGTSSVSYLAVHPLNPQRVLVVTSSGVHHSTDAGNTWTSIGAGLPSGTKYCATWENTGKDGIYVGGFGFVAYTNNDLNGQWVGFFDGLPNARVYELEINYVSKTIFAGTYGRGLWESPLYESLPPVAALSASQLKGCQEMTVTFTDESANNPSAWEWTFTGGTPATSTERNPTVTYATSGVYAVRLRSSNAIGENITEIVDYLTVFDPVAPVIPDVQRCDPGEVSWQTSAAPGEEIRWYANLTDSNPLFVGNDFTTNIAQNTTFYAASGTDYPFQQFAEPSDNTFGTGGNHNGDYYLILDAIQPFRLKSALVYASGAGDRVFQLRDENDQILQEKTVYVNDGENRVFLNIDIPAGANYRLGCPSPANLFRSNAGVGYPYEIAGLLSIKSSTAGADYYYYLYHLEVETTGLCESERVPVQGLVGSVPMPPNIAANGVTELCDDQTVTLEITNPCTDCTILWSNGATTASIVVDVEGDYSATLHNDCGESMASTPITISKQTAPTLPSILVNGPTSFCAGETLDLTLENVCANCNILWSNGETSPTIAAVSAGMYAATVSNVCGESSTLDSIEITLLTVPETPVLTAGGATTLCPGQTVFVSVSNACSDCSILWSNGSMDAMLAVSTPGFYTATLSNECGESALSTALEVSQGAVPPPPSITAFGTDILCPGFDITMSINELCDNCTIHWSTGESDSAIVVSAPGIYSATFSNGCGTSILSNTFEITQGTPPAQPEIIPLAPTTLCPGQSVELMLNYDCPACTVEWSTGENGPSIVVDSAGTFFATLSNACGEGPMSEMVLITNETPPAAPEIGVLGSAVICQNSPVTLSVLNSICTDCTVQWSNGETGLSIQVNVPGTYTATVMHNTGLCGNSALSNEMVVQDESDFLPEILVANNCELTAPDGSNYQWYFNDTPISGATTSTWMAQDSGFYSLVMLSPAGCSGTASPVYVAACISKVQAVLNGIKAQIYPNPALNRIYLDIQLVQKATVRLELFGTDGRLVGQLLQTEVPAGRQVLPIELPQVANGLYRYVLTTDLGRLNGSLEILGRK